MKKVLSILLALCLCVPVALAFCGCKKGEKATAASEFKFIESKNGYWMVDEFVGESRNVVIPSKYQGKDVVAINGGAFSSSNIESVVIPGTVWNIYEYAFSNCVSLKTVTVKAGNLQRIYNNAFDGCNVLKSIDFSGCENLTTIDKNAFRDCFALSSINLSGCKSLSTIGSAAFYQCESLKTIDFSASETLSYLDSVAFAKSGVTKIIIPKGTTLVGDFTARGVERVD